MTIGALVSGVETCALPTWSASTFSISAPATEGRDRDRFADAPRSTGKLRLPEAVSHLRSRVHGDGADGGGAFRRHALRSWRSGGRLLSGRRRARDARGGREIGRAHV